jgi:hypothetical protein
MRYPEEDYEEKINSLPRHVRDEFQPDGMNSPPEAPPRPERAPCAHNHTRPLPGFLGTAMGATICLGCGKVFS